MYKYARLQLFSYHKISFRNGAWNNHINCWDSTTLSSAAPAGFSDAAILNASQRQTPPPPCQSWRHHPNLFAFDTLSFFRTSNRRTSLLALFIHCSHFSNLFHFSIQDSRKAIEILLKCEQWIVSTSNSGFRLNSSVSLCESLQNTSESGYNLYVLYIVDLGSRLIACTSLPTPLLYRRLVI